jgi:hypothetical protein
VKVSALEWLVAWRQGPQDFVFRINGELLTVIEFLEIFHRFEDWTPSSGGPIDSQSVFQSRLIWREFGGLYSRAV